MLRLKRNVDLKQLEDKFGIIQYRYDGTGEIILEGEDFCGWVEIDGFKYKDYETRSFDEEDLYDLIKANLIEKVGDKDVK